MNKRDFIVRSSALLAGAAVRPTGAQAASETRDTLAHWKALEGECFEAHTATGRLVTLTLTEVRAKGSTQALDQFTVRLQGPRALPLHAGLHELAHPLAGELALYLEPVAHGPQITYDAHFSLLT